MAEAFADVPREEKPVTITPVRLEGWTDRVNKPLDAVTDRAYEIFEGNGQRFEHELDDWSKAEVELLHSVPVHIADLGESLEARAEVPGFDEKEIDISVEPRRLTITGKRATNKEEKKGNAVYSEFCSDQIQRVVDLPASVDARKVTATLKSGVLQLTMPKVAKARTIEIKPRVAQSGQRSR
jgi:HSP20 family molecular chaperone IbpA